MAAKFLDEETSDRQIIKPFNERSIFPILTADRFLLTGQRKKIISEIRPLTSVPDEHYEALYQKLINNFACLVQALPVNNEARLCSLLDEGLLRGRYVLELQQSEGRVINDPLMTYVLFSAALLLDAGHTVHDRLILISNPQGDFIREWYPYHGPMLPEDGYYRIRRGGGLPSWVCQRMTPLLARQVLPEIGFNWIIKDAHALNVWLALLLNDKEGAGALSLIFNDALELLKEFQTTQEYFQKFDVEYIEVDKNALGEDFLEWLKRGIDEGQISINKPDSNLQIIEDGILINLDYLLARFSEIHKVDSIRVKSQLEKLGALKNGVEVKYRYALTKAEAFMPASKEALAQTTVASALFGFQPSKPLQDIEAQKNIFLGAPSSAEATTFLMGAVPAALLPNPAAQIMLGQTIALKEAINNNIQLTQIPENLSQLAQHNLPPLATTPTSSIQPIRYNPPTKF